jgi:hypothetical protein
MFRSRITPALLAAGWLLGSAATSLATTCTTNAQCDDGNACTIDTCDTGISRCLNDPNVSACGAFVDIPVPGRKIKLRVPPKSPDRNGVRMVLRQALGFENLPVPDTSSDPVINGASMRIFSNVGDVFDRTYPLPAEHWSYFPLFNAAEYRGYQYKDAFNAEGPFGVIKIIAEKTAKFKAKGDTNKAMDFTLGTNPRPVGVILTLGATRYCMNWQGAKWQFKEGKIFWSKDALAPAACPCVASTDCSNGDAGDGVEQCVAGFCEPGTP